MTNRIAAIVLAAILGAAVAGSYVWAVFAPNHVGLAREVIGTPPAESAHRPPLESFWERTASDPVAAFTLALVIFTGVLAFSTIGLWVSTRNLWQAGERQFLATHRPRIKVRFVQGPITLDGGRVGASITVANAGPTNAIIVEVGCDIAFRRGADWITNVDAIPKPVSPIVLRSGARHTIDVVARDTDSEDDAGNFYSHWGFARYARETSRGTAATEVLCVAGEVVYQDGIRIRRHTSFLRLYDPESGRWTPDIDPGNEYED